jgi:hypothetical protein
MSNSKDLPHRLYWMLTPEAYRFDLIVHGSQQTTAEGYVSALVAACDKNMLRNILADLEDLMERI